MDIVGNQLTALHVFRMFNGGCQTSYMCFKPYGYTYSEVVAERYKHLGWTCFAKIVNGL